MIDKNNLQNNLINTLMDIKKIALKCGVDYNSINLVAASKTMPIESIRALDELNLNLAVGENKAQELVDKYILLKNLEWHFIGNLQTNKVKYIIDKVNLIHSVDRINLVKEIDKQAKKINKEQNILIEINIANEPQKGGINKNELVEFINSCSIFNNINILGIMTVLPINATANEQEIYFKEMKMLYDSLFSLKIDNLNLKYLSMGMTCDYKCAIENGSNMLRLGRAIFGERNYNIIN